MMKFVFFIFIILFGIGAFSQSIVNYKLSECETVTNYDFLQNRIIEQSWTNDTLHLKIGFIENCDFSPKVTSSQSNDSLFLEIENISTIKAVCECNYKMDFKIKNLKDSVNVIIYKGSVIKKESKSLTTIEYNLTKVDKNNSFPYQYKLDFTNLNDDSSSYTINNSSQSKKSTISITDYYNNEVVFSKIKFTNLISDSTFTVYSNFDSESEVLLINGKYSIEVSQIGYDTFVFEFEIKNDKSIELSIKLGLSPQLKPYLVHSKIELSETELLKIMNCIKENPLNFNEYCSDNELYYISLEI